MTKGNVFRGHDWRELAEALNVALPEWYVQLQAHCAVDHRLQFCDGDARDSLANGDDWLLLQQTRAALLKGIDSPETAQIVRAFLTALREESDRLDFYAPVWDGMLAVKNGATLIKCVVLLLPTMWT